MIQFLNAVNSNINDFCSPALKSSEALRISGGEAGSAQR